MSPDEPAFILVIDEIQGIACPDLLDLFDIFFERHLISCEEVVKHNKVAKRHLALSLDDNLFDETLIFLEVKVVDVAKGHTEEWLSTNVSEKDNILR